MCQSRLRISKTGKSLILYDGTKVLGDYNGGATVRINLQEVLNHSSLSQEVAHLMRLTENLYIALESADLNPSGYDGLSGETFYGSANDIDTTAVNVESMIQGDDSIDVDSFDGHDWRGGSFRRRAREFQSAALIWSSSTRTSPTTTPRRFSLNTQTS